MLSHDVLCLQAVYCRQSCVKITESTPLMLFICYLIGQCVPCQVNRFMRGGCEFVRLVWVVHLDFLVNDLLYEFVSMAFDLLPLSTANDLNGSRASCVTDFFADSLRA